LLLPIVLLVVAFLFGTQEALIPRPHPAEASGGSSGAGVAVPGNYDMEQAESDLGTPPANYQFSESSYETGTPQQLRFWHRSNCTLSGWTVNGSASARAAGQAAAMEDWIQVLSPPPFSMFPMTFRP